MNSFMLSTYHKWLMVKTKQNQLHLAHTNGCVPLPSYGTIYSGVGHFLICCCYKQCFKVAFFREGILSCNSQSISHLTFTHNIDGSSAIQSGCSQYRDSQHQLGSWGADVNLPVTAHTSVSAEAYTGVWLLTRKALTLIQSRQPSFRRYMQDVLLNASQILKCI